MLKPPGAAEPHGSGGPPKTPESRTSNGRMARNKNQTLAKLLPKATIGGNGQDLGSGGILRSVIESTVLQKRAWGLIRIKNICAAKGRVQGTEREPRSTGGCRLRRDEHRGAHGRLRPRRLRNGPPEKRAERRATPPPPGGRGCRRGGTLSHACRRGRRQPRQQDAGEDGVRWPARGWAERRADGHSVSSKPKHAAATGAAATAPGPGDRCPHDGLAWPRASSVR